MEDRPTAIHNIGNIPSSHWSIYTDGSKIKQLSGAGFCVFYDNKEFHRASYSLGSIPTVFQCELFALHMAATWAKININLTQENLHFLSDSTAALQAINSTQINSRQILSTVTVLNELGSTHKVTLRWVPGHEGVAGNELADTVAKLGSSCAPIGPEPFVPFSNSCIKQEIRNYIHRKHLSQYKNIDLSQKGKLPLTLFLVKYKYKPIRTTGKDLRWITWLLSGHSPLAYFQYRSKNFTSPICDSCHGSEETSEHYLCECPAFATQRQKIFGNTTIKWSVLTSFRIEALLKYIESTGRFNREHLFG